MRGDPSAEALSYKQVSRSAMHLRRKASGSPTSVARSFAKQSCKRVREPLLLSPVNSNIPCGQRVSAREAEKKRRSRFAAWKAWRGIEGHNRRASGGSRFERAKPKRKRGRACLECHTGNLGGLRRESVAEVGRGHSSVEAG